LGSASEKLCAFLASRIRSPIVLGTRALGSRPSTNGSRSDGSRSRCWPSCASRPREQISALDEIIPLLFAPQKLQVLPTALVAKGKWSAMNAWLDTVCRACARPDVEGVADQDEWIEACHAPATW